MSAPRFEVVRRNWYRFPRTGPAVGWRRVHGGTVLATFPTRDEAEREAANRERTAREAVNPFCCGIVWADRTEMPELAFADWVADHDLPEPPGAAGRRDWAAWWDRLRVERSAAEREMVWGVLANLRFFAVREREPGPRLFVLYRPASIPIEERVDLPGGGYTHHYDGRTRLFEEGGQPLEVSLDRPPLDSRISALFGAERTGFDPEPVYDVRALDFDLFTDPGPLVYVPLAPEHLFRVGEVPLDAKPEGDGHLFVVCRVAFTLGDDGYWAQVEDDAVPAWVPVQAFHSQNDAVGYCAVLNRHLHEVLDPVMWAPGWSNGTCAASPLLALAAEWGLPPPATQDPPRWRPGGQRVNLGELGNWWEANSAHLTRERRAQLWANLGDYQYLSNVFAFVPGVLGMQEV